MPITWKNISGPNFGSANNLAVAAGQTISSGLDTLRGAAQEVTDEQIRQFDTQADVNTAGILSNIGTLDQAGIDTFDVNALTEQFGSQFDSTQIADALGNRADELRGIAQQETENQLAQDRLGLETLRTNSGVARDNAAIRQTDAGLTIQEEARKRSQTYNRLSTNLTSNLGQYNSLNDLQQAATNLAAENKLNSKETTQLLNEVSGLYSTNVGLSETARTSLNEEGTRLSTQANQVYDEELRQLNLQAEGQGLSPTLLNLRNKDIAFEDVANQWKDKKIDMNSLARVRGQLSHELGRAITPGELEYILPQLLDAEFLTDDEFEVDGDNWFQTEVPAWTTMKNQLKAGNPLVNQYYHAQQAIANARSESQAQLLKDLGRKGRQIQANNALRFRGENPKQLDEVGVVFGDQFQTKNNWFGVK